MHDDLRRREHRGDVAGPARVVEVDVRKQQVPDLVQVDSLLQPLDVPDQRSKLIGRQVEVSGTVSKWPARTTRSGRSSTLP